MLVQVFRPFLRCEQGQRAHTNLTIWPAPITILFLSLFGLLLVVPVITYAQQLQPGMQVDTSTLQWPRFYSTNGFDFAVYQPQISSWPSNELNGRFVVAVRASGATNETYGVVFFQARTEIDKVNRLVSLEDFQITRMKFPSQPSMEDQYRSMLLSLRGQSVKVVPLDHLEALLAASSDAVQAKAQAVVNDPPQIFYSTQPALLILVNGPPVLSDLAGNYQRVINTRAILLWDKDPQVQAYYLYADSQWFSAPALTGLWTVAANPPLDIDGALSAALATKEVDPLYPKNPEAPPVRNIYVSTVPAELLETTGDANLLSIIGTDLLYVNNSSSAIFYDTDDENYYVLISGRWFKSGDLQGPWAFVPPGNIPGDFQKIPPNSEKSNVLLSVPGTPQAQEAVIANSIPQTASIQRDQASLQVNYFGDPGFAPISGTTLYYATNSATPVVMVDPADYYACQGGVWFEAAAATGPWTVATTVPPEIYNIPADYPIHYVTYAYVYGSTPTEVYVGYTPGYMGTVVAPGGVVVYGTGYNYAPAIYGSDWVGYPPTYGYGASFALGAAVGYSFGYCAGFTSTCWCEPYWGSYHWAAASGYSYTHCNVNGCNLYTHWGTAVSATGTYGYNSYTGNQWASHSAATFNPYTGTRGVASSSAAYNPYTGNAVAARSGSRYNPSSGNYASGSANVSGNFYNGTASVNRSGTAGNTATGNSVSWNNGNLSADKDGNVYSYNQSSGAQKYNAGNSTWAPASSGDNYAGSMARQDSAQSLGAQRFDSWSSGGGGGWGGSRGRGGGGRR